MRRFIALAALCLATPALADDQLAEPPAFELSATAMLTGQSGFIFESDRVLFEERGQPEAFKYPGMESWGGGFGLFLQARFEGRHSVEIGFNGTLDVLRERIRGQETDVGLNTLRVPLMYYFHLREPTVIDVDYIWTMGLGAEYVLPGDPSLETDADFISGAVADPYTNVVIYFGREFRFLNAETKALEWTLRFDVARMAMRTDWLVGDRALATELDDGTLQLNGEIDIQFSFGVGVGFGLL